jgi:hypothetical protein
MKLARVRISRVSKFFVAFLSTSASPYRDEKNRSNFSKRGKKGGIGFSD